MLTISARSITFSSSRTFPGQACVSRARISRSGTRLIDRPSAPCLALMKCQTSSGTSSAPLAQGRDGEGEHVEAVEEVGAEPPLAHVPREVAVGRGQHPHVHLDRLRGAQPLERPALEHAQQLGLHAEGQLADLVEEDRAAVGHLEAAEGARDGAGEGALLVAEQLALDQGVGKGGAVDGRRAAGSLRRLRSWMARATRSLPVPVSPRIRTGESAAGDLLDLMQDLRQRRARAHDLVEALGAKDLLLKVRGLGLEPVPSARGSPRAGSGSAPRPPAAVPPNGAAAARSRARPPGAPSRRGAPATSSGRTGSFHRRGSPAPRPRPGAGA